MKRSLPQSFCCVLASGLALVSAPGAHAQTGSIPLWTNIFAPNSYPWDLVVDGSGNVLVTGRSEHSSATVKYSSAGIPVWTNIFNVLTNSPPGYSNPSAGTAIAVDSQGNAFVTATSWREICATVKYSAAGVPLWTNYLGAYMTWRIGVDDNSGNVFVGGWTNGVVNNGDYITAAYSSTGVPLWTNYYSGPQNLHDQIQGLAVDRTGNVVVTGTSAGDVVTIKYSPAGVPLWTNRYDNYGSGIAGGLGVDGDGNVFTGFSGWGACTTIKYSSAGVPLWTNHLSQVGVEAGFEALTIDRSGNPHMAAAFMDWFAGKSSFVTVKYSGAGLPLWTNNSYSGPENLCDIPRSIAVDASGNVFVFGETSHALFVDGIWDLQPTNFTTFAYSSAGIPLWTNRFFEEHNRNVGVGYARDAAVDSSGNLAVTGTLSRPGNEFAWAESFVTIKYGSMLPRLTISRTASNTAVISWPSGSTGFTLQQNSGVNQGSNWSNVTTGLQDDGTTKTLFASPLSGSRFYRLSKPQ